MGSFKASMVFNVPQTTLEKYAKMSHLSEREARKLKAGRKPDLTNKLEAELANHCLLLEQKFFRISTKDVRRLAYQIPRWNCLKTSFSVQKQSAGNK